MSETGRTGAVFAVLIVLAIVAATFASNAITLSDRIALGGWSPIDWVNHLVSPANFAKDFGNGIDNYHHSLFMHIYPSLYNWFGVSPENTIYFVVALEIAVFAGAGAWLTRALFPEASPIIPALVAIILVASSLGAADLSRIATKPFFAGLYYNVADAARLMAVVFVLKKRWLWAALALAFATATHPIMGGLALVFVAVWMGCSPTMLRERAVFVSALLYACLAGAWVFGEILSNANVGLESIPTEDWIGYSTFFSAHWYPYQFGTLTDLHGRHLLPLLGFVALFYHYLPRVALSAAVARGWHWGIGALVALTILGVVFATWVPEPFLIKLNLTRASKLILWLGLPVVVMGLVRELTHGAWLRRPVAGVLLLSPFISVAVVPALAVAVLVLGQGQAIPGLKAINNPDGGRRTEWVVASLFVVILGWYVQSDYFAANRIYYFGDYVLWVGGLFLALAVWSVWKIRGAMLAEIALLVVVAITAGWWIHGDYLATEQKYRKGADYKAVQVWANQNTQRDALFYIDPTISYGWRDYSQRSSFGNVREWLHTSWLYDSSSASYADGLRRFGELDVDVAPFMASYPTAKHSGAFMKAVRKRVYERDDAWRTTLAQRYGIDYFVFERSHMGPTSLRTVFESKYYVVLSPSS